MILEAHDGLANPLQAHATRLLVCGDDGTPLVFVLEYPTGSGPARYRIFRAGDPDFNEQLRASGIQKTVVVQKLDGANLRAR